LVWGSTVTDGRVKAAFVGWESDRTGAAGDLLRLLPELPEGRFATTVIFRFDAGNLALDLQHERAVVLELGNPGMARPEGFIAATAALHRLRRILEDLAPAVAHGLDEQASALVALAGRMAGVPVLTGAWRGHGQGRPGWRRRSALRRLDAIVAPSEAVAAEVSAHFRGRHPPIAVIPPGIDPREVQGRTRAPEFSEPRPRIGTIARLAAGSGVETMIEAAGLLRKDLPDLEWLVAGTGADAIAYLRATQRAGLDGCVRLLGDREDAGPFLASLDAYVEPGGADAFPAGLLQALAAGVPCVAARNPTLDAALQGGAALLVGRESPAALAAAVARVLSDAEGPRRASLRAAGQSAARPYSAAASASLLVALHESLIAGRL
jgi:glycosyltransferase involved in cell wall biosynthesis